MLNEKDLSSSISSMLLGKRIIVPRQTFYGMSDHDILNNLKHCHLKAIDSSGHGRMKIVTM